MIKTVYSIFVTIVQTCTDVWNYLQYSLNDIITELGLSFAVPFVGELTLLNLIIGSIGLFIVLTLVKWAVGL